MGRLSAVAGEAFDVVVIGGGIVGCGIARDAALRGLRVALVERRDFGSGTTSASTRIVHGGLRYLEMLDFALVRLDLRERQTLLRIASHLVKPLEFLIPFFKGSGATPLKMRVGLALYDALSYDKSLPSRRWLSPDQARDADSTLRRADIRGAAAYHDARIDSPERLALENVLDAEANHAAALNYVEAISLEQQGGRVSGVRVRDVLDGGEAVMSGRVVVNATGAWFDRVTQALTARPAAALRTTKGIHVVCRPLTSRALVLFSKVDGRLLFAIPRGGLTWIGTTDTDFSGDPADARATRRDVEYVLDSVREVFPALSIQDVLFTTAGVRALVRQPGSESSVSRMHRIVDGEPLAPPGMMSVLGGKITGYRAIAEDVTDRICARLGLTGRLCRTATEDLPGARTAAEAGAEGPRGHQPQDPAATAHLYDLYGARAREVLQLAASDAKLSRPLAGPYPDLAAQVIFSVRHEHCLRLSDFLRRRTLLGGTADQGSQAAAPAAALMAEELSWTDNRLQDELDGYRRDVAATQAFKTDQD